MEASNFRFEFFPPNVVFCSGVGGGGDPNPDDIVNVSFVEEEIGAEFGDDSVFVASEEEVGVVAGGWCAHGGAG